MDYIYLWIRNIAFYLVMIVVVMQLVPGENYKKYIKFFTGMIFILMLLQPITSIFGVNGMNSAEYQAEIDKIEEATGIWKKHIEEKEENGE